MTHGLGLTVARIMQCTPSEDRSLDSNHHAQQQGFALMRSVSSEWSFPQLQILNGKGAIQYEYLRIILNYYSNRLSVELEFMLPYSMHQILIVHIAGLARKLLCATIYFVILKFILAVENFFTPVTFESLTDSWNLCFIPVCCFNLFSVDDD